MSKQTPIVGQIYDWERVDNDGYKCKAKFIINSIDDNSGILTIEYLEFYVGSRSKPGNKLYPEKSIIYSDLFGEYEE